LPTIVHFEIPADDIERTKKFYSDIFGWKIDPIDYWIVTTTDKKGNYGITGGIMKRQMPKHQVTNYIGVNSVEEYSSKVEKHGGKIVASKKAVPGMGYFALCLDTENNAFAIWEVNDNAR
jgi:uncharacterized protein